jgi:pilus assembly protein CpaC
MPSETMEMNKMRQITKRLFTVVAAVMVAAAMTIAMPVDTAEAGAKIVKLSASGRVGRIQITAGVSETFKVSLPFAEIVVGDPETADVNPLTDKTLYILGRKLGLTNIALFDENRQLVGVIDLEVTHDLNGLRHALKEAMPNNKIKVRSINGRILLEGTVPSAPAAERAMTLAREFSPEDGKVSNSLSVSANQQVNLEVRFVEVNRTAGKELGVNLTSSSGAVSGNTGVGIRGALGGIGLGALSGSLPFGTIIANVLGSGANPDVLITALEQKKLARRLAEPNLTALSGESASFHAGGEFPIPIAEDDNKIKIEFKEFGVKLSFTPVVLDDGLINLKIRPEVSEIDAANSIRLGEGGVLIPGLSVRKAETSVELRDGQSFAIAGLLQSVNSKTVNQVPWLGDVPVLGSLFRSSSFQKKETDLVIIVTPRLVRPVGIREQLKTPLDAVASSNEPELFLLGKTEVSRKQLDQKFDGQYGHIIDFPKVDHGNPNK